MDIEDIRLFLTVVSYPSISEASRKLFLSQQALSQRITRIEKQAGCKLLNRGAVISPTPAGTLRGCRSVQNAYR